MFTLVISWKPIETCDEVTTLYNSCIVACEPRPTHLERLFNIGIYPKKSCLNRCKYEMTVLFLQLNC